MKAVSLTQPWATLIAIGAKRIETRSWRTRCHGPIAIHAAQSFPRDSRSLCFEEPFREVLYRARMIYPDSELSFGDERFLLPRGAIVAVAYVVDCLPTGGQDAAGTITIDCRHGTLRWELSDRERAFGDFRAGRFAWLLADVRPLPKPIPCTGARRLWTVPPDIAQRIGVAVEA